MNQRGIFFLLCMPLLILILGACLISTEQVSRYWWILGHTVSTFRAQKEERNKELKDFLKSDCSFSPEQHQLCRQVWRGVKAPLEIPSAIKELPCNHKVTHQTTLFTSSLRSFSTCTDSGFSLGTGPFFLPMNLDLFSLFILPFTSPTLIVAGEAHVTLLEVSSPFTLIAGGKVHIEQIVGVSLLPISLTLASATGEVTVGTTIGKVSLSVVSPFQEATTSSPPKLSAMIRGFIPHAAQQYQ